MQYLGIDIASFLPTYKDQDDPLFQEEVSSKMEYQKFKASAQEPIPKPGQLFKHQALFLRWIRFNNSVLVMSDMGTGKTIQFIAPAEYYHKALHKRPMSPQKLFDDRIEGNIKRCVIIVKNKVLVDNIQNEIINYGYKDTDFTVKRRRTTNVRRAEASEAAVRARKLSDFYTISKQKTLANQLHKMTDEEIRVKYSDSIIVFDEIHAIKLDELEQKKSSTGKRKARKKDSLVTTEGVDVNFEISRLFTHTRGCKYIIASATPMINSASEIFSIFNLIVPMEKRMNYTVEGVVQNEINADTIRPEVDARLHEYFRGRVSYVARLDNGVRPRMMGEPIGNAITTQVKAKTLMKIRTFLDMQPVDMSFTVGEKTQNLVKVTSSMVVYKTYMTDYQTDRCNSHHLSSENVSFRSAERVAAMFVYPGTPKEYEDKMLINGKTVTEPIGAELKTVIRRYGKYLSCKYDRIVDMCDEEDGKSFCYTEFKTKGSNIFAEYFNAKGWERVDALTPLVDARTGRILVGSNYRRYAVLDGDTLKTQVRNILNLANHPDNADGRYLRVVVGTRVSRDGINLFAFKAMHLIDGGWTDAGRDQAMMRVIRAISHEQQVKELRQQNPDAFYEVHVYRHCAIQKRPNPVEVEDIHAEALRYGISAPFAPRHEVEIMIANKIVERIEYVHALIKQRADPAEIDRYYAQFDTSMQQYMDREGNLAYHGGIDVDSYVSGQLKTVYIRHVEKIMREEAFDRAINNDRNELSNQALGIEPMYLGEPDISTYNIIDPSDAVNDLQQQMIFYFSNNSTLSKEDITHYVEQLRLTNPSKSFPNATIDIVADKASTSVIPTLDYTGYPVRIMYENGIFYRSTKQRRMNAEDRMITFPTSGYIDIINTSRLKNSTVPVNAILTLSEMPYIREMERIVDGDMRLSTVDLWHTLYNDMSSDLHQKAYELEMIVRALHPNIKEKLVEYASMRDYYMKNDIPYGKDLSWLRVYLESLSIKMDDATVGYVVNRFGGHIFVIRESSQLMSGARSMIMKLKKEPRTIDDIRIKRMNTVPSEVSIKVDGELVYVHAMSMFKEIVNPYNIENKFNSMRYTYRVFKPDSQQPYRVASYTEIIAYNYVIQIRTINSYAAVRDSQVYGILLADNKFRINDKTAKDISERHKDERSRRCESFIPADRVKVMRHFWMQNEKSRPDIIVPVLRSELEHRSDIEFIKRQASKTSGSRLSRGAAVLIKVMTGLPSIYQLFNDNRELIISRPKKPVSGTVRNPDDEIDMIEVYSMINNLNDTDVQLCMKYMNMSDEEACDAIMQYMRKYNFIIDQYHLPNVNI